METMLEDVVLPMDDKANGTANDCMQRKANGDAAMDAQTSNGIPSFTKKWPSTFPCCRKKVRTDLTVFILVTLIAVATIIVVVTIETSGLRQTPPENRQKTNSSDEDLCTTPECTVTAASFLKSMDPSVDPCEDFFEYACGGWNARHMIPDDRAGTDQFYVLHDQLHSNLRSILNQPIPEDNTLQAFAQAHTLYMSCMNEKLIEARDTTPVLSLIHRLGGWPVLDKTWSDYGFDIIERLVDIHFYTNTFIEDLNSNKVLFKAEVKTDFGDAKKHILTLDQADLGMVSREFFLQTQNNTRLQAYKTLAINVAIALGADPKEAKTQITEMVDFEVKLANITTPEELRRNHTERYNKMSIVQLSYNVTHKIDWLRYLNLLFSRVGHSFKLADEVVVEEMDYYWDLAELLERTSPRVIANYMIWRVVMNLYDALPRKFQYYQQEVMKVLAGVTTSKPRWRRCVSFTNYNMGWAVGRMFAEEYFDEKSKTAALEMVDGLRKSFKTILKNVDWMTEETKKVAEGKIDDIVVKIGYPRHIMNDTALDDMYSGLGFKEHTFFENTLACFKNTALTNLRQLQDPSDRFTWTDGGLYVAIVNAAYYPSKNQMTFPAGILQPPFYSKDFPMSVNYGSIGMVIGHELTHGFDDQGRQYDKDGNLRQWWATSDIEQFKNKARCIIEQYVNYTVKQVNLKVNGIMTQGENIADNGGLKQAFKAYRTFVKQHGEEETKLPGLDLDHNKVFFLSFARMFCGKQRPEDAEQQIQADPHAPNRIRVLGTLSNSKEFADAYQCPLGSRMNPVNKCSVW